MTRSVEVRNEIVLLAVLLIADALFYAVVIPYGIADPAGFGLDEGLPPSFPARVAAGLLALVMVARLGCCSGRARSRRKPMRRCWPMTVRMRGGL